ncbi:MAG: HAD family hydrolase, partial [Desulfobacterales bacterium]|nr:HAD family hydrolase [Desulfobacterales bacterium]
MKVSAVIFDCDGVMFDSRQANITFYNHILSHFDLPPMTAEDIEFVHMNTAVESLNHIFRQSPYLAEAQEYRLQLDYTPFIRDMVMEPGLKEVLDFLKPRCGLAVATNRSNTIGRVLELNGLSHYFDIVVSSLDVTNPKPHPEPIFKILDFFGIEPDECFYVGDSEVDFEVCQAAGVPLIAYKNKALRAPIHVESLPELKDILRFPGRPLV